ncbi:MAG: hypothetical protein ACP5UR_09185, partial [Chloroflexus sp.]
VWQRNYYEHIIRNDESLNIGTADGAFGIQRGVWRGRSTARGWGTTPPCPNDMHGVLQLIRNALRGILD